MSELSSMANHSSAASPVAKPRLSRRKRWLFRLAAVVFAVTLLGVLELALRLGGVQQDLRLVKPAAESAGPATHYLNDKVDLAFYGRSDLSGPEPRTFQLPKPEHTYRIVFLGGSTVIGFPYLPEVAFPRHVERHLQQQNPDLQIEVLNVGITAMNSFAVVDLLQQCLACDPDLVVIHSGHNEFYGPGGAASSSVALPYPLVGPAFAVRRTRISQVISSLTQPAGPAQDDLLDILPRVLEIPAGSATFRNAEQNYRRNLQRAVAISSQHKVPLILSTVACNLKDQSPLNAAWPADVPRGQQANWEGQVSNGELLLLQGKPKAALHELQQAEKRVPGHARVSYRQAQCLEALQQFPQALQAYQRARDEDTCRFRAPASFAEIVRDIADSNADVGFLDIEQAVLEASSPAGPGHDFFLEHVHYTFAGHELLGRVFARGIQQQGLQREWSAADELTSDELAEQLGVVPEDHLAAYSSAIEVLQTGPLKSAIDSAQHETYIIRQIARHYAVLEPDRQEAFAELPITHMVTDLTGTLEQIHRHRGQTELANLFARLTTIRRPWQQPVNSE